MKLGHAVQYKYIYLSAYLLSFSSVIYNTDCSCKSLKRDAADDLKSIFTLQFKSLVSDSFFLKKLILSFSKGAVY